MSRWQGIKFVLDGVELYRAAAGCLVGKAFHEGADIPEIKKHCRFKVKKNTYTHDQYLANQKWLIQQKMSNLFCYITIVW